METREEKEKKLQKFIEELEKDEGIYEGISYLDTIPLPVGDSELNQFATPEEIMEFVKVKTEDEIEERFKHQLPMLALARLNYMVENDQLWSMLTDLYEEKKLIDHLLEVQDEAMEFLRETRPRLRKTYGISEELRINNPIEFRQLSNTMESALQEMVQKEVIERV